VEDVGSGGELKPLFPMTAEMVEGEKRLLEMIRRDDEEVAEAMARLRAEEAAWELGVR
jgi:hypothetical protein